MDKLLAFIFVQLLIVSQNGCSGISCFVCSSRNGSFTDCEDPFNAHTSYIEDCKVTKRGDEEEIPAHFCIQIKGILYPIAEQSYYEDDNNTYPNESIVIRRCVSDKIESQCGSFRLANDLIKGCIQSCDVDGCNSKNSKSHSNQLLIICFGAAILPLLSFIR